KKFPIVVVLDDIRSLNNIGSFFRTADAFNIEKIILFGITASPPHKDIHKTALGSTETVRWEHQEDKLLCLKDLKNNGYELCVLEQTEQTTLLQEVSTLPNRPTALIFGNEVNGVAQELVDFSDRIIEIPQFGTKHSLNVSVCAGIVMWEFCKKYIE
ncbi:RNA methyltransferase, partial [Crocinitomicaceae bacterium]|nr:RNA methyltransferase [Crocinitomicaceae bacterium]